MDIDIKPDCMCGKPATVPFLGTAKKGGVFDGRMEPKLYRVCEECAAAFERNGHPRIDRVRLTEEEACVYEVMES